MAAAKYRLVSYTPTERPTKYDRHSLHMQGKRPPDQLVVSYSKMPNQSLSGHSFIEEQLCVSCVSMRIALMTDVMIMPGRVLLNRHRHIGLLT